MKSAAQRKINFNYTSKVWMFCLAMALFSVLLMVALFNIFLQWVQSSTGLIFALGAGAFFLLLTYLTFRIHALKKIHLPKIKMPIHFHHH
jgi:hypothetical protein